MTHSWDVLSEDERVSSFYTSGLELLQFVTNEHPFDEAAHPSDKLSDGGFVAWCARSPRRLKNIKLHTKLTDKRLVWSEGNLGRGEVQGEELVQEISAHDFVTSMNHDFLPLAAEVMVVNSGPCSVITRATVRGDGRQHLINRVRTRQTPTDYPFLDAIETMISNDAFLDTLVGDIWASVAPKNKREIERIMRGAFSSATIIRFDAISSLLRLPSGESGVLLASEELVRVLNLVILHCPASISTLQVEKFRVWPTTSADGEILYQNRLETLERELRVLLGDDESVLAQAIRRNVHAENGRVPEHSVISGFLSLLSDLTLQEVIAIVEDVHRKHPNSRLLKAALVSLEDSDNKFAVVGKGPLMKTSVFFSYSHRDEELRKKLEVAMSMLKNEGLVDNWHDRRIGPGEEWKDSIDRNLRTSDVVLLLVSPDFVASKYCYDVEMALAMERHEAKEATVIPVILRATEGWTKAPFGKLQALPVDGRPVVKWDHEDDALEDVAKGIRRVITSQQHNNGD